jgi:hypothetical protein
MTVRSKAFVTRIAPTFKEICSISDPSEVQTRSIVHRSAKREITSPPLTFRENADEVHSKSRNGGVKVFSGSHRTIPASERTIS